MHMVPFYVLTLVCLIIHVAEKRSLKKSVQGHSCTNFLNRSGCWRGLEEATAVAAVVAAGAATTVAVAAAVAITAAAAAALITTTGIFECHASPLLASPPLLTSHQPHLGLVFTHRPRPTTRCVYILRSVLPASSLNTTRKGTPVAPHACSPFLPLSSLYLQLCNPNALPTYQEATRGCCRSHKGGSRKHHGHNHHHSHHHTHHHQLQHQQEEEQQQQQLQILTGESQPPWASVYTVPSPAHLDPSVPMGLSERSSSTEVRTLLS